MSDEYLRGGEENKKEGTDQGSEEKTGYGYYQINQSTESVEEPKQEENAETKGQEKQEEQQDQNVTYHYSYRRADSFGGSQDGRSAYRAGGNFGGGNFGRQQNFSGQQNYGGYSSRGSYNSGSGQRPGGDGNYRNQYNENHRYSSGNHQKKEKSGHSGNGKKFGVTITLAVIFGLVAAVVFQGANRVADSLFPRKESSEIAHTQTADSSDDSSTKSTADSAYTVADVASSAMPSVVAITAVSVQELPNFFGFGGQEYDSVSSGSGIIVGENDTELLIATNNHVIEGAKNLSVCFIGDEVVNPDETQQQMANGGLDMENAVSAKTKGTDAANDLAVIAVQKNDIPSETMSEIKIAQQGDAENLVVGEQVVAIGNAMGYGQSVTSGWISALDRTIDESESSLIQTDAAINPGNSGGALLNMKGELIGINSAKFVDSTVEGMGFAIPISTAAPILEKLMSQETRDIVDENDMGYMGIQPLDISSDMIQMYDMPEGVFVSEVLEDTGAEKAGMKKGDIITNIEGQRITTSDQLLDKMQYYKKGETIEVVIQRSDSGEYQEITLDVTLGERPQE